MSRTVYVFHPRSVIDRIKAGLPTVHVEVNKDAKGVVSDSWMTLKIEAVPIGGQNVVKGPAYFRLGRTDAPIMITKDLADPNNKEDFRNKKKYGNKKFETTVSKSGLFGEMMDLLVPIRDAQIQKLLADGVIKPEFPNINQTIKRKFSDNKDVPEELRGKDRKDPLYRISFEFDKFSDRHPAEPLRGKQKSNFKGTVIKPDGKPAEDALNVNEANVHTFLKRGVRVVNTRILMDGISMTKQGISNKILINEGILMEPEPEAFSDELPEDVTNAAPNVVVNTTPAPVATEPELTVTPTTSNTGEFNFA
ncbi:hypothetical protein E24_00335 [Faustovirus]|nr:hypothetical protein PRJ_Fausto_00317 [Faustovirus]AMN83253.1 hypothetical protein E24_00335 [Faustovirus]AMN84235.1 hypothetical protein D5a_00332 [Faustovirus]AMN85223.1 hypothetical protein E23_00334 [Faustovirus]QBR99224.1 hypothetical protein [Faustovirus mariensis]